MIKKRWIYVKNNTRISRAIYVYIDPYCNFEKFCKIIDFPLLRIIICTIMNYFYLHTLKF